MFPGLNFFFLTAWNNTIGGLNGMVGGLQGIAYALLAITFLMGVYEAFIGGPSFRQLGVVVLKYAAASGIVTAWSTFIADVVSAGAHIGTVILGGGQDTFLQLSTQYGQVLADQVSATGGIGDILRTLSNGVVGTVELALFALALIWFQVAMQILTTCFCLWGGVLFCIGPLLIALAPSGLTGSYTRPYVKNLAEWAMWPAIYAIFADLMVNLNMGTVSQIVTGSTNGNPVGGLGTAATGVLNFLELTVAALVCGLCMVAVPLLAHIVIGGNFSQAFGTMVGLGSKAMGVISMAGGGANGGGRDGGDGGGGSSRNDDDPPGGGGGRIGGGGSRSYSKPPRHTEANDSI
jgi:hypothetical protein